MVHRSRMKIFNVIKETHIRTNISFKVRRHIVMICSFFYLAGNLHQAEAEFLSATLLAIQVSLFKNT